MINSKIMKSYSGITTVMLSRNRKNSSDWGEFIIKDESNSYLATWDSKGVTGHDGEWLGFPRE